MPRGRLGRTLRLTNPTNLGVLKMFAPLNARRSVAAILMITAFSPLAAHGGPVAEVEPNDSLASAQNIDAAFTLDFNPIIQDGMGTNTSTLIPHASIIGGGDPALTPDYFSFTVNDAGLSGVFDVDSGSVFSDTALYLFDSAGNLLAQNNDASVVDFGSFTLADPFLEYTFASAGLYVIGVGGALSSAGPGGIIGDGPSPIDSYTLNATVAVPEPMSTILFCTGIAGLGLCHRRRRRRDGDVPTEVAGYSGPGSV